MAIVALFPVLAGAAMELGPALSAIGAALLGGAAVAGVGSLSGDTAPTKAGEKTKGDAAARTLPNSTKKCEQCPPEQSGRKIRVRHGVNWPAYSYQARVTGFAFDREACTWSDEWEWLGVDFDGFRAEECLLQEAKGNYDQFLDAETEAPFTWFTGFKKINDQVGFRANLVHANPPTQLVYYFKTPLTRAYFTETLSSNGITSVLVP